jgi:tartrate-resistant acid phosphatase type 5
MKAYSSCAFLIVIVFFAATQLSAQDRVKRSLSEKKIKGLQKDDDADYFLVVGDWGRNGQGESQAVADWMGIAANQFNARFVVSTGDNFYCCGVASTEDHQWLTSFENVFTSHSLQVPWYVTLGNHDYEGNVQAQIDYGKKCQRWKLPARYYTKAIRNIRFVFIDTSPFIRNYYKNGAYPDLHKQDTSRQLVWLDSVLSSSTETRKIVVGHHPVYSVGEHGSEPDLKSMLEPRLEKYGVNLYVAGHDHSLQSLHREGSEVRHLISGGGSERTPVKYDPSISKFAKASAGFLLVAIRPQSLNIYFIDSRGKLIYSETTSSELTQHTRYLTDK